MRLRRMVTLGVLAIALILALILALGIGAVAIAPSQVVAILVQHLGITTGVTFDSYQEAALTSVRLPRLLLALASGATLGIAGASLQALFRNPLAEPLLIGVSGGAACGAVAWIVFGGLGLGLGAWGLPFAAFGASLIATAGVMLGARGEGRLDISTLLLSGLAMNALTSAILGYIIYLATESQVRALTFWMLGSLGGATWDAIAPAALLMALGVGALVLLTRPFNALALGEAEAGHLGVPVERVKLVTVVAVALGVGASTALTGVVGFVGLVSPHIVRLIGGSDHRFVIPGSALLGALIVTLADVVARTLVAPAELPIGVVTSAIGAPFFFWLLRYRTHQAVRR
ncbi:MAG: iron chelate uptake ABC transporter family permease subunit [Alphaproteobacteria bacterium]|nr:iron chelate uptake ABC transporter family permease subunit [Alphaproteobacteria bacterium]